MSQIVSRARAIAMLRSLADQLESPRTRGGVSCLAFRGKGQRIEVAPGVLGTLPGNQMLVIGVGPTMTDEKLMAALREIVGEDRKALVVPGRSNGLGRRIR